MGGIAVAEAVDKRQREPLNNKLGHTGADEPHLINTGTLLDVVGHHAAKRGKRRIVEAVHREQQQVGHRCIDGHQRLIVNARIPERQHIEHAEGDGRPYQPRAVFAPAGVGAVGDDTDERVDKGTGNGCNKQYSTSDGSIKTEDISIELQLIDHHHLENEIGGYIPKGIAHLLAHRNALTHIRYVVKGSVSLFVRLHTCPSSHNLRDSDGASRRCMLQ